MPDTHFYRYDDYDRALVGERVEQFRDQVRRRIAGELTEEQFKPLRLTNGLYLQLHAYMLRIAIPYGTLSSRQLRKLAEIARKYDRGYGHFTTRQNLQLNWIKLEDAPDALAMLAEVDMHAIQTVGNVIRNVTADHFAGAAVDEIEDPRIWCEIVRQWSTLASRIQLPAAQVQDRHHRLAQRPRRRAGARRRPAAVEERAGRGRLRGDRGRRPRPHAADRQDDARVPAQGRAARLSRGRAARLQPLRPARQHLQGAHQDPGARDRRREDARGGRGRIRRDQGQRAEARARDHRGDRAAVRAAAAAAQAHPRAGGRGAEAREPRLRAVAQVQRRAAPRGRAMPS